MPYLLYVDDNFHYMKEDERYLAGRFDSAEAALAEARSIVDSFLKDSFKPGMSAKELYDSYVSFGEDPFIVCEDVAALSENFSAWSYAETRCEAICAPGNTATASAQKNRKP